MTCRAMRPYLDPHQNQDEASGVRAKPLPPKPPRMQTSQQRTINMLIGAVAESFDVPVELLCSRDRHRSVVKARQALYWLLRRTTELSSPEIGRALERDHATILTGVRAVEKLRRRDPFFAADLDQLLVWAVGATDRERNGGDPGRKELVCSQSTNQGRVCSEGGHGAEYSNCQPLTQVHLHYPADCG